MKPWWYFNTADVVLAVIALCLMIWLLGNNYTLWDWLLLPPAIMAGRLTYHLAYRRRRERRNERRGK